MMLAERRLNLTVLNVEDHSKASVETARLDVGTIEWTSQRGRLEAMEAMEAMEADLEADLEVVAMENMP